ncbi:MAG: class I SAM-dependent methyltransferase [Hyphomicrobiales bacterium]
MLDGDETAGPEAGKHAAAPAAAVPVSSPAAGPDISAQVSSPKPGVLVQLPALRKILSRVPVVVIGKGTAVARSGKHLGRSAREVWLSKQTEARARSLSGPYRALVMLVHRLIFDRSIEQLFFRPTREWIRLSGLHIPAAARERGHDHFPTPRLTFEWVMNALPGNRERSVFIDYGAGRGRALLMACAWPFEKAIGIEFSPELAEDCRMNIAQFPRSRMRCRDVECICADMLDFTPPAQEAVHYFMDPVAPESLLEMTQRIVERARAGGHAAWIVCVGIDKDPELTAQGLQPVPLPFAARLKLALFSPYRAAIFRTPEPDGPNAASADA